MKKLELKKQTICSLTQDELAFIKAGAQEACWENLWTVYTCKVIYTGPPTGA